MEGPATPSDIEQCNIIDKLAEFVARNGHEFEALTRDKQQNNPKFAFLQGGEFHDYYNFKVEEARKRWPTQRQSRPPFPQQQNYDYSWNGNRPGGDQGGRGWDQYNNNGGGDFNPRFPPQPPSSQGGGWSGPMGNQWCPPPPNWPGAGRPPFQAPSGMPNMSNPAYGVPPGNGMPPNDAFRGRGGFGMQQPPFGYPGGLPPPPHGANESAFHHQSPGFAYPQEGFNEFPSSGNFPPAVSTSEPELGETDIEESEKNLKAQYEVLIARQTVEIKDMLDKALVNSLNERGIACDLTMNHMEEVIQPLIEACTKENISKGKNWVIEHGSKSKDLADVVCDYLLSRCAAQDSSFELCLYLVYLLNDLLHHCKRRGASSHLQDALHRVVPLVFCLASARADSEKQSKLNRVLSIWDSNAYLPPTVLEHMKPEAMELFLSNWKVEREQANESAIEKIKAEIEAEYSNLEQQHNDFSDHVRRQLAAAEQQKLLLHQQQQQQLQADPSQLSESGGAGGMWGPPPGAHSMPPFHPMDNDMSEGPHHRMHHGDAGGPGFFPPGPHPGMGPGFQPPPGGWGPGDLNRGPPPSNWSGGHPPPFGMGGPSFYPPHGGYGPPPSGDRRDGGICMGSEDEEGEYNRGYDDHSYEDYHDRYDERHRDDGRSDRSYHHRQGRPSRFSASRHETSSSGGGRDDHVDSPAGRSRSRRSRQASDSESSRGGSEARQSAAAAIATIAPPPPQPELPIDPATLVPKCPSWELPAGLMHSLIRLSDFDYTPLAPEQIRLLPPKAPSEHLLSTIDAFYWPPSHDRTRDGEGWERLGLYEFYTKKEKAREFVERSRGRSAGAEGDSEKPRSSETPSHRHRRRRNSGGSSEAASPEDDSASPSTRSDNEHTRPFQRDVRPSNRPPANHLSQITAYPTAAIGQGIRTGAEALSRAPPPMQCMQGQLTHNYPGYKAAAIPPPSVTRQSSSGPGGVVPPTFPGSGFLQFPPPNMSQPPPNMTPQGLVPRPHQAPQLLGGIPVSSLRSRGSESRNRSRSRSRSESRSRSRSRGSRSFSRSRSRSRSSSAGRSRSRTPSRRENGAGSSDDRRDGDAIRASSLSRRRRRSRSRSGSVSPSARFTSANGPGGFNASSATAPTGSGGGGGGGGVPASARAAALAVAASINNSFAGSKSGANSGGASVPPPTWSATGDTSPVRRTPTRSRFNPPGPNRVSEMHLLGTDPSD